MGLKVNGDMSGCALPHRASLHYERQCRHTLYSSVLPSRAGLLRIFVAE
jgi:hypothetical protein